MHYEKHADGTVKCIEDEIPFEVPEGWEWTRIGALTEYITSGSRGWAQYYSEEGALFLRMGNLSRDSFKLRMESIQRVQLPNKAEGIRTRVAANDLLFSITAEIGNLGLIPEGFEEAYINQHIGLIRFMSKAQGRYIPYAFLSDFCRSQYLFTVSGLKNSFRLDNIQSILIPIPPAAEQVRIVSKLDALWTLITIIEADKVGLSYIVSRTKEAILSLAIRGQLIPQNPDDEPASVLLERIRIEKEDLVKQGKIKRDKRESVIFRGDDNSYYERVGQDVVDIAEELPFSIPDSWYWARISSVFEINPRNRLNDELDVSFIPMPLIEDGFSGRHTSEIKKWGAVKTGFTHFSEGDIGIAKITPCFENRKSTVFCNLVNGFGAGTTELHVLRSYGNMILPEYALAFVKTQAFINAGKQEFTGAVGQQRVGKEYISETLFPVPPYQEQVRIVEAIRRAFSTIGEIETAIA